MLEAATLLHKRMAPGAMPGPVAGTNQLWLDAFDDEDAAPIFVPNDLREIVPLPAPADTGKLEDESSHHRVLFVRGGAVIAVTTLIAVGGALLIHALLAGVIVVGTFFPWSQNRGGGSPGKNSSSDTPGSFSVLGSGPADNAPPSPSPVYTAGTPNAGIPAPPVLAALPEISPRDAAAQLVQPASPDLPVTALGSVHVSPPTPVANALNIAPPQNAGTASIAGTPGTPARGSAAGNGGGDDDGGSFTWVKGGGLGGSNGEGTGLDRGFSAADRSPQQIGFNGPENSFTLPTKYQINPPKQSVLFTLTIAPDGSIAAIHLDQSCGIPDVDELAKAYILSTRWSPGYKAGKAVTSDTQRGIDFDPIH